uniref:Tc1-like transposase DDE domain-containing protein n=1 Tax=Poecilia mexicana TaxID=48701 RepID=A0A3B3Y921_9TELE
GLLFSAVFLVLHVAACNNITLLDHPACSPHLNPIENIWGWMARKVYKNGHQFQTVDALREAIFNTWSNVPTSLLETLASSMPKRFLCLFKKLLLFLKLRLQEIITTWLLF